MPIVNPNYYLTRDDVYSIYTQVPLNLRFGTQTIYNPASQVRLQAKISTTRNDPIIIRSAPGRPGIIDASKFDRIYVNSDIHSDYRNFINYLKNLNLINTPPDLSIYEDPAILNSVNHIYSSRFITDTTWKAPNTLYIIVGDLVDGRRSVGEVDDRRGSFDLLLHMFIYNLRLRALEMNSDILFTIGNHDFLTAIRHTYNLANDSLNGRWSNYSNEITDYTKMFFSGSQNIGSANIINNELAMTNRFNALTMFYSLSPYLFIQIENSNGTNIYFIHSTIANTNVYGDTTSLLRDLIQYQTHIEPSAINNNFILDELPTQRGNFHDMNNLYWKIFLTLNDRDIVKPGICNNYSQLFQNSTLIVGHCPTHMYYNSFNINNLLGIGQEYERCDQLDNFGCILPKCFNNNNNFKLIAVDTGFSRAFRTKTLINAFLANNPGATDNIKRYVAARLGPSGKTRVSEILKIKKSNNLDFDLFYRVRWNPYTQFKITNNSVTNNPLIQNGNWAQIEQDCLRYVNLELTGDERNNKKITLERVNELVIPGIFDIEDVKSCLNNIGINIIDCLKYVTLELTGDERNNKQITPERVNELVIPGVINIDNVRSCLHNIGVNIIQLGGSDIFVKKYLKYKKKYLELKKYIRQF